MSGDATNENIQRLAEVGREYVRQRSRMLGPSQSIHTVHADPEAEPVELDLAWLSGVVDALESVLDSRQPEPEWEYRTRRVDLGELTLERRRKAGPWEPVKSQASEKGEDHG